MIAALQDEGGRRRQLFGLVGTTLCGMSDSQPGYRNQGRARTLMRLVGVIAMAAALTMIVLAVADFFSAFSSDEFGAQPTKFWLFFLALPFFFVGAFCLNAGFLGAGARYAAGEVAPTARTTMGYLGLGAEVATCPQCGADTGPDAKFCDDCGSPLSKTCPSCAADNEGDARFCAGCGVGLT